MSVRAGDIIVIPITGTATITANKFILGLINKYSQSTKVNLIKF